MGGGGRRERVLASGEGGTGKAGRDRAAGGGRTSPFCTAAPPPQGPLPSLLHLHPPASTRAPRAQLRRRYEDGRNGRDEGRRRRWHHGVRASIPAPKRRRSTGRGGGWMGNSPDRLGRLGGQGPPTATGVRATGGCVPRQSVLLLSSSRTEGGGPAGGPQCAAPGGGPAGGPRCAASRAADVPPPLRSPPSPLHRPTTISPPPTPPSPPLNPPPTPTPSFSRYPTPPPACARAWPPQCPRVTAQPSRRRPRARRSCPRRCPCRPK